MRRTLILCLFLILSETSGQCATNLLPPLQPIDGSNGAMQNYSSNITSLADPFVNPQNDAVSKYSDINRIEQTLFGRTYSNQDISARLSRIEKSLFTTTYPNATSAQRIDNIISNFNQINKFPNISQNVLSKMESKVFNQTYPQNRPERRIERLEEKMLGAVQSGDLSARYEALKIASRTYDRVNQDAATPTQSKWKGLTQGLSSAFSDGDMTGFTPPIGASPTNFMDLGGMTTGYSGSYTSYNTGNPNPFSRVGNRYSHYNPYSNPYGNRYGGYRNNGFGNTGNNPGYGYYEGSRSFGSGAGVTILD